MMANELCPIHMSGHGLMGVDGVDGGVLLDHAGGLFLAPRGPAAGAALT